MGIDAATSEWLKKGALFETGADAAIAAAWGATAVEAEMVSALATQAGATAEAARQIAFWKGPLAVEVHDVPGLRSDLLFKVITVTINQLGYNAGLNVFVIFYEEQELVRRTRLTVLRPLP